MALGDFDGPCGITVTYRSVLMRVLFDSSSIASTESLKVPANLVFQSATHRFVPGIFLTLLRISVSMVAATITPLLGLMTTAGGEV